MKCPVQCAKQQVSPSTFTKYCACHEKWLASLILMTYHPPFATRRAARLTLQPHQTLRHATQNDTRDWCPSHMKRHLQCAAQQDSPSNVTTYYACHEKWFSSLILFTYETSFTMRGATGINLQPHQILPLPRKTTLMIDARHIWHVIYNAQSNRHHPPTSPNITPATQNCIPKSKRNLPKTVEASFTLRGRFDHDPTMKLQNWTRPFAELTFPPSATHFVIKITTFRAPTCSDYLPGFTKYCACHEKWRSKITKCCACREKWLASLILVTYETSFSIRGPTGVIHQRHQALRLPRKMTRIIDPHDISSAIYNAQSSKTHPPTSPNSAPAT